jgi:hypothetical protein
MVKKMLRVLNLRCAHNCADDEMFGIGLSELREGLVATLRSGRWDRARLREMAETCGTKATLAVVDEALRTS